MSWFYNLKTKSKLLLAFGAVCAAMIAVGFFANDRLGKVNASTVDIASNWLPSVAYSASMSTKTAIFRLKELQHILSSTDAEMTKYEGQMHEIEADLKQTRSAYEKLVSSPEERRLLEEFSSMHARYSDEHAKVIALSRQNKNEEAKVMIRGESQRNFDGMTAKLAEIVAYNDKGANRAKTEAATTFGSAQTLMGLAFALIVGFAFVVAFVTARPIEQGLGKAVEALQAMANRDFTQRLDIETRDEVGQMATALNEATTGVQTALKEVRDVADAVASAAQQLTSSSEEISSGAQEQAASLEQTSANLEEITTTVKQNADNAQQANQLASGARDVAEKGGAVVGRAVSAMGEINTASKKIADIITTIDEIAFQTNLLALNAAVEAARAGEQGRGFAVVAAEVRNLAQRSAGAAKEIKGLIQDSVRKVEGGAELVNQSGQRLDEIVTSVKRVTDLVAEVAQASREQSTGVDQVQKAVTQMDTVTQANAAQTEELSGTAEAMSAQASQLQKLVAQFRLGDEGSRRLEAVTHRRASKPARRALSLKPPPRSASSSSAMDDAMSAALPSSVDDGAFESV